MKIIAYDTFKPGVTLETITPYLQEEVANVWRLWKAGVVRENYARADVPGVVIVFECASVAEAKTYVEEFPLSKNGFLDWQYIALDAPLPLEYLFNPGVDTRAAGWSAHIFHAAHVAPNKLDGSISISNCDGVAENRFAGKCSAHFLARQSGISDCSGTPTAAHRSDFRQNYNVRVCRNPA